MSFMIHFSLLAAIFSFLCFFFLAQFAGADACPRNSDQLALNLSFLSSVQSIQRHIVGRQCFRSPLLSNSREVGWKRSRKKMNVYQVFDTGYCFSSLLLSTICMPCFITETRKVHLGIGKVIGWGKISRLHPEFQL